MEVEFAKFRTLFTFAPTRLTHRWYVPFASVHLRALQIISTSLIRAFTLIIVYVYFYRLCSHQSAPYTPLSVLVLYSYNWNVEYILCVHSNRLFTHCPPVLSFILPYKACSVYKKRLNFYTGTVFVLVSFEVKKMKSRKFEIIYILSKQPPK